MDPWTFLLILIALGIVHDLVTDWIGKADDDALSERIDVVTERLDVISKRLDLLQPKDRILRGAEDVIGWHCLRCDKPVDYKAFKCECTESPSPWTPVYETNTDPDHLLNQQPDVRS